MKIPKIRRGGPGGAYAYCWDAGQGKEVCLGRHGSPEAKARYLSILEHVDRGSGAAKTVGEIVVRYWEHCKVYYRTPSGGPSGRQKLVRSTIRSFAEMFGELRVDDLGPQHLVEFREAQIDRGLLRTTVNDNAGRIVRMVRWASAHGLCDPNLWVALKVVPPLAKGRSRARESAPVKPVPREVLDQVLAEVHPDDRDLILFQLHTGCRPGEAVALTRREVGPDWFYRPTHHKNSHLGKPRHIAVGPKAREILQRRWEGKEPHEVVLTVRGRPTRATEYRVRVRRACLRAGVEPFHPHQLKHNHHTEVRRLYGLEVAREVAGHSSAQVTAIYAERDLEVARRVAEEIG